MFSEQFFGYVLTNKISLERQPCIHNWQLCHKLMLLQPCTKISILYFHIITYIA